MSSLVYYKKYLIHQWKSQSEYTIHSPFVFDFCMKVLKGKKSLNLFKEIEKRRADLLANKNILHIEDFGAGSLGKAKSTVSRKVGELASKALKAPYLAQILGRASNFVKAETILELGTCLGITTSYFALECPKSTIFTIEGSSEIAKIARQSFDILSINNIRLSIGNFDIELPKILPLLNPAPRLFYIDGNHRLIPTLDYFSQLLEISEENDVFIFDDIHWSDEMEKAWKEIQTNDRVYLTLDLFYFGIVFLKNNRAKEHFKLRLF